MALPVYNAAKHHVGLGLTGAPKGLMITPGYQRRAQHEAQSADFGGEIDLLSNPSMSRWTQDDFSGGEFQYRWGKDNAMFARCEGFLPTQARQSLRTVPYLYKAVNYDFGGFTPFQCFAAGGYVFYVEAYNTLRVDIASGAAVQWAYGANPYTASAYDREERVLYLAERRLGLAPFPQIFRANVPSLSNWISGSDPSIAYAGAAQADVTGIITDGEVIYIVHGQILWAYELNDNRATAPVKTRIGRLPGKYMDHASLGGITYILCADAEARTQVVYFDGSNILPFADFPFTFTGQSIESYAGRLYVGGKGSDISGSPRWAELYELSGSSIRLLKSWQEESLAGYAIPADCNLHVHDGMLCFAQNGQNIVFYDATTDAFFNGPLFQDGANVIPLGITTGRRSLFVWARHTVANAAGTLGDGFYRMVTPGQSAGVFPAYLETSDFNPEPARKKRWGQVTALSRYGQCQRISYSVDGGATWTAATVTQLTEGDLYYASADLSAVTPSKQIRLKFECDRPASAGALSGYTEFIAYTTTFVMLDTGRSGFSFTVVGANNIQTLDGGAQTYSPDDLRTLLWDGWKNQTPLEYKDLNGQTYKVQIVDVGEAQPDSPKGEGVNTESYYNVTLLEI